MKFEKMILMKPVEVSIIDQIREALEGKNRAAVILAKNGDDSMYVYYRSGVTGGGGAWWLGSYNAHGDSVINLEYELANIGAESVYLFTRDDLDEALLNSEFDAPES